MRTNMIKVNCTRCNKPREVYPWEMRKSTYSGLCLTCWHKENKHPRWNGGQFIDTHGYVCVLLHTDDFFFPMATRARRNNAGYVMEHRLIMARHLGRLLHSWEFVHHKNGIKTDNRIENLELKMPSQHSIDHHKGYKDGYQKGYEDGKQQALRDWLNLHG